jgi:hypothetical protein
MFVLTTMNYYDDQIKKNETGGACGEHGGDEKCVQKFGWKGLKENTTRKT